MELSDWLTQDERITLSFSTDEKVTHQLTSLAVKRALEENGATEQPHIYITAKLGSADFYHTQEETLFVASKLLSYIKKKPTSYVIDLMTQEPEECAGAILFWLGPMHGFLKRRHEKQGSPKPQFYRSIGQNAAKKTNIPNLGKNYHNWINHTARMFRN